MSNSIMDFEVTSGALADAKGENTVSATIMNGNDYASNVDVKVKSTGSAVFSSSGGNEITLTSGTLGNVSANFYDAEAETVTISMYISSDESISQSGSSTFVSVNLVAEQIILLISRDDARADGSSENELLLQTVAADGVPVPTVSVGISLSNGATFVDGNSSVTVVTSDDDGTVTLPFTNVTAGETKVKAYLVGHIAITAEADSNFNEVKPILDTTLRVISNNAVANGVSFNQVEATVTSHTTGLPLSGADVTFHVTASAATFNDSAKSFTTTTDGEGKAYARLISSKAEVSDTVTAETYSGSSNSVFIDFTEDYSDLSIIRIFNSVKSFSGSGPTVAWPNATIYVQASGGSGDYSWKTNYSEDLVYEESGEHSDEVYFTFSSSATHDKEYTITVTDLITGKKASISFSLDVFFSTFGSWKQYDWITPSEYPSLGELTALFKEWGDMSKYDGWLIPGGSHYWSNTEVLGFCEAVNLVNGKVSTFSILTLCGVAIKKK